MKRLGLLGGTFNPPHMGHLHVARQAYKQLALDAVWFVPTNLPSHKALPHGSATAKQRCEMVSLLLQNEPWAKLCTLEIDRGGVSYTIDTLRSLCSQADECFLILGTDMFLSFETWKDYLQIFSMVTLAVMARDASDLTAIWAQAERFQSTYGASIAIVHGTPRPISSTQLRQGGQIQKHLSPAVFSYIRTHQLYQFAPTTHI